jgi:hypothetical protein
MSHLHRREDADMNLYRKELREILPIVLAVAAFLLLTGWTLNPARHPSSQPLIQPFVIIRYLIGLGCAAVLGSSVFAVDRERGTQLFMSALPLSSHRLFAAKILAGLTGTVIIILSVSLPDMISGNHQNPLVILLVFAIGQVCGIKLGHTVNASALSSALGLAVFCGLSGSDVFHQYPVFTNTGILVSTVVLMGIAWCIAGRSGDI